MFFFILIMVVHLKYIKHFITVNGISGIVCMLLIASKGKDERNKIENINFSISTYAL